MGSFAYLSSCVFLGHFSSYIVVYNVYQLYLFGMLIGISFMGLNIWGLNFI